MTDITNITTAQLQRILSIKQQIEGLQGEIESIAGGEIPIPSTKEAPTPKRKYHMTAAHRRKLIKAMAKARKIRLAMLKATGKSAKKKGKRRLSAAGRAAIIAGTKARWARVKGNKATPKAGKKKDRRSSPATRAKLAAAARARWAKVKAEGKKTL